MNRTIGGFNLDDLVAVLTVAEHRSFRSAARALELPPSSLSHIVSAVERRLGIRIFHRTTRSVSPTEAGQAFIDRMGPALTGMADAIESVNRFRDTPCGQVRINTSNWAVERAFPVILDFLAAYPEVSIDIVSEGRLVDIVSEGFDAGLRLAEAVPQDMVAVPLSGAEAVIIVASPGYLHKFGTPQVPSDLLHHECIRLRLPGGGLMRWEVAKAGERSWIDVRGRLIVGASEFALSAAVAGLGIAYVDAAKAMKYLESGLLVRLMSEWTPPFAGVCLYYPRQRLPSAAFRAFIDHVKTHTAASVPQPALGM